MGTKTYNPERDITPRYLSEVFGWVERYGEVLVIMRYLCGGGSKDFALVHSKCDFERLVEVCPEGTDIIAFRDWRLPLRGVVTEEFIKKAEGFITEDCEYLFIEITALRDRDPRCNGVFDRRINMRSDLEESLGEQVALGICPNFSAADHDSMISASKGGIDGPR